MLIVWRKARDSVLIMKQANISGVIRNQRWRNHVAVKYDVATWQPSRSGESGGEKAAKRISNQQQNVIMAAIWKQQQWRRRMKAWRHGVSIISGINIESHQSVSGEMAKAVATNSVVKG